ncbi:unnamed protein product, partial [Vitis vinifera]
MLLKLKQKEIILLHFNPNEYFQAIVVRG